MLLNEFECLNCGEKEKMEISKVFKDELGLGYNCSKCGSSSNLGNEVANTLIIAVENYFQIHNHIQVSVEHAKSYFFGGGAFEELEALEHDLGMSITQEEEEFYIQLLAKLVCDKIGK